MSEVKPRGFGAPFWARRIEDAVLAPARLAGEPVVDVIAPVLEELIAQTRLDEAMACRRNVLAGAIAADAHLARIANHRRDLRAAKRRAK